LLCVCSVEWITISVGSQRLISFSCEASRIEHAVDVGPSASMHTAWKFFTYCYTGSGMCVVILCFAHPHHGCYGIIPRRSTPDASGIAAVAAVRRSTQDVPERCRSRRSYQHFLSTNPQPP
jgi:hypothetical protein